MLFYQGILITDTARRPIGRLDRITHDTSLNLMELLPSLSIRKVRCNFLLSGVTAITKSPNAAFRIQARPGRSAASPSSFDL